MARNKCTCSCTNLFDFLWKISILMSVVGLILDVVFGKYFEIREMNLYDSLIFTCLSDINLYALAKEYFSKLSVNRKLSGEQVCDILVNSTDVCCRFFYTKMCTSIPYHFSQLLNCTDYFLSSKFNECLN